MKLSDLLKDIAEVSDDVEILGIATDSREVKPGFLFLNASAADYSGAAVKNGAVAVVAEKSATPHPCPLPQGEREILIEVSNIRKVVSTVASRFYPNQPSLLAAVTGTNGKTSTVSFFKQLVEALGEKAATIGTLGLSIGDEVFEGSNTTPGAAQFHRTLGELKAKGIEYAAFEASSHGLDQHRTDDIDLRAAGFTNLTRDHIDYHKTMENYLKAKERLFYEVLAPGGVAVLNADAPEFEKLAQCGRKVFSYGKKGKDLRLVSVEPISGGQRVRLEALGEVYEFEVMVSGYFQVMNILCAIGLVNAVGFPLSAILQQVSTLIAPAGRMEFVAFYNGAEVYVDYAHTPDALENALKALRSRAKGKLRVLFGCGGDRDPGKRPMMGKAAADFADVAYVTDDNPRSEDPALIRAQVLEGSPGGINAGDRESAIKMAVRALEPGDVLLAAGKGHEAYQIINGEYFDFDDKVKIKEAMKC